MNLWSHYFREVELSGKDMATPRSWALEIRRATLSWDGKVAGSVTARTSRKITVPTLAA